ncbi:MAG: alpha/beta hydrolase [Acidimicrobiia bacterium]|nr:alpha/beta hydrolase [Acidimicrobiia bacterium]
MTWVLLAVSVVFFVITLNSFHPVRRNRVLFVPSFFLSWLTNELAPFYSVVTVLVGGLVVVGVGAVESWVEVVTLGFLAATLALLVVIWARGRAAAPEVAKALADFGDGQSRVTRSRRRHYQRTRDVEFARAGGRRLKLDVIEPSERGEKRPAILQIHGGGWVIGDKREQGWPLLKYLASNGWVGFNANYRLSPGATWPDHLVDCKRALAWIRANADDYGVDPDFVVVTGGSAGGHLTAMMALTANDPQYQPGFRMPDTTVQAAVPFYGVYDFTDRYGTQVPEMRAWVLEPLVMKAFFDDEPEKFAAASPMDQVHRDAPPFLVVHGTKDTLAPVADAREFVRMLRDSSRHQVFYVELEGAQHAFDIFSSPRTRRVVRGVERFLFGVWDAYASDREGELHPPDKGSRAPDESARGPETHAVG